MPRRDAFQAVTVAGAGRELCRIARGEPPRMRPAPELTIADVDSAFTELAAIAGSGSNAEEHPSRR